MVTGITEIIEFKSVSLEYLTFSETRLPEIGIYYTFKKPEYMGICREFKVDLQRYLLRMGERIFPIKSYEFKDEDSFLKKLEGQRKQAIRTSLANGINFLDTSNVVAEIHRNDFFRFFSWLKEIELK